MNALIPLLLAILLVPVGGVFAAIDSALMTVSAARVEDLVRADRPGARRLARITIDRPRYVNLMVLLRLTCEIAATVLLVAALGEVLGWGGRWPRPR
ncbi:Domain of uncharacterised function DUF21 [Nocardia africana]|uniref:Domain of uncharacterized function DUF21 n=1 Tax=Nocardia africana TaxID=134964 RepID=A0A378X1R6_9NOCA|nr:Domain of uncharacterised function DUF21 [Nocardia africana]